MGMVKNQSGQDGCSFIKRAGMFVALLVLAASAQAAHFRGGQLNWIIPDPVNAPRTVEFTLITTWAVGRFCNDSTVNLDFGDGSNTSLSCTLLASGTDSSGNVYEMGESTVTHNYAADGNFVAFHAGGNRIAALQNASNDQWRIESNVALGNGNTAAPQAILFTLNQMEIGGVQTLSFPMGDADNDPLSCRLSTGAESSISTPAPVLGNTISVSSSNNLCSISWDTTGGIAGDLYAISVAVESVHNAETSRLTLDFILELVTAIPITSTINGAGDGVFVMAPGDSVSVEVTADHSADQAMNFTLLGALPPGAVLTPASGTNNPDLTVATLTYTAGFADQGNSYPMVFSFSDASNLVRNFNVIVTVTPQDTDGDGLLDKIDGIGVDSDGDGVENYLDLDSDNDGILDAIENTADTDGDGVPDRLDLDADNDGIYDVVESGAAPAVDANNDGRADGAVGINGLPDVLETALDSGLPDYTGDGSADTPADSDGDGVLDFRDLDSDNDGITDSIEAGNSDPDLDGIIGTGVPAVNGDGLDAAAGAVPTDTDTDGAPDYLDLDSDGDGLADLVEAGVNPALDTDSDGRINGAVGGNGLADAIENGSGQVDYDGNGTADAPANTDADALADYRDLDSDNDGVPDASDAFPADATESVDTDGDGVGNNTDIDSDNDGITDAVEGVVDTDGDGVPDWLDLDSDNDGIYDVVESGADPAVDADNDGRADGAVGSNGLVDTLETAVDSGLTDYDNNGAADTPADTDSDGVPDFRDLDSDNDSITDVLEVGGPDADADGLLGSAPLTVNSDGLVNGAGLPPVDTDADNVADFRDLDSDGDTLSDIIEAGGSDANSDGLVDGFTDADANGYDDSTVFPAFSDLPDTDADGTPDFRDNGDLDGDGLADDVDIDDDNDGIPDTLEGNNITDTDGDGVVDARDLDSDNDGLYDFVEAGADAALDTDNDGRINGAVGGNGLVDSVETLVDSGLPDYDGDGATDLPLNSDNDGQPDFQDLDSDNDGITDISETDGSDPDGDGYTGTGAPSVVNANGVPAGTGSTTVDTDGDGVPDYRDLDTDNDGITDAQEDSGTDANGDGRVDGFTDTNGDGLDDTLAQSPRIPLDSDADNVPNYRDLDSDNDGLPDLWEAGGTGIDTGTTDGIVDGFTDTNGDGLDDLLQTTPLTVPDTDGDGTADYQDTDSDGDGISDLQESGGTDTNGDGRIDGYTDANNDGLDDSQILSISAVPDSNGNGIPDYLDADGGGNGRIVTGKNGVGGCALNPQATFSPVLPALLMLALLAVGYRGRRGSVGILKPRHRVFAISIFAALLLLATAGKAENAPEYRWYAGAGVGMSNLDPDSSDTQFSVDDKNDLGYKIFAGYSITGNINVEAYFSDLGEAKMDPYGEVEYQDYGIKGLYTLPVGRKLLPGLSFYLGAGGGKMRNSSDLSFRRDHDTHLTLTAGAEYALGNRMAVRFDVDLYDEDARLFSISLLRRFSKR